MAPLSVVSNWSTMLDGMKEDPQLFYLEVQKAMESRNVPDVKFGRAELKEGGFFSAKREYLTIRRGDLNFLICGAPFGTGFFVSWWLFAKVHPWRDLIRRLLRLPPKMDSCYQQDTTSMYRTIVHRSVLDIVDDITKSQGKVTLPDIERQPVLSGFFK